MTDKPQLEYPVGLRSRLKGEFDMIMRVIKDELERAEEIIKTINKMEQYSKKMGGIKWNDAKIVGNLSRKKSK